MADKSKKRFSIRKFLLRTFAVFLVVYVGICALLYFMQDQLLFHPQPLNLENAKKLKRDFPFAEELSLKMADGVVLRGWLMKEDDSALRKPTIIYFPGNAEEVSYTALLQGEFSGCNLVLVNYRGYGESGGKPSEEKFFSDALEIYDTIRKRTDVDPARIISSGRSIGTGVATYLSSKRKAVATVLITPYDNMAAVAREKYPWVPVQFLLRHKFDSESYAKQITGPALMMIASADEVIPPVHAERLAAAWGGSVTKKICNGYSHNSIQQDPAYYQQMRSFVYSQVQITDSAKP